MTSSSSGPVPVAAPWRTPWRRRASGSCCSSGATSSRGRWTTGTPTRSSSTGSTSRPTPGTTATGNAVPASGPLFRRWGHQALRRRPVPAAASRTSGRSSTSTACRRPGRSATTTSSRGTAKAEWLYQVHGTRDEDPTEGHWSKPYPWPAVSHEPRLQEIYDALKAGLPSVLRPGGHHARRGRTGRVAFVSAAPGATATRAWCTPSPTPRSSGCGPCSTCRTSRCSSTQKWSGSRPTRPGAP